MKRILLMLTLISISLIGTAQSFKRDVVIEIPGSEAELYSSTKMYISEHYNMSEVLENDDPNARVLFIRPKISASTIENIVVVVTHWFTYTVKFYHKDGKVRMISELYPVSSTVTANPPPPTSTSWKKLDISSEFQGAFKNGISKNGFYSIKSKALKEFDSIEHSYSEYMKNSKSQIGEW